MSRPLVSVIVPIYKVEAYLDKCVRSIVNQTYRNIEIILVDDGSPDQCPVMCDVWAKKDERIKVIHKENGGLSSARNAALDICQGTYIGFVDSDDYIEPEMYEQLLELCKQRQAKVAIAGRWDVWEQSPKRVVGRCPREYGVLSSEDALKKMLIGKECACEVWDKLYHRSCWDDVRFPEGKLYEDIAILYKVIEKAGTVAFCPKPFYNYLHRSGSITGIGDVSCLVDYAIHTEKLLSYVKERYPSLTGYAVWTHVQALRTILSRINRLPYASYKENCDTYSIYKAKLRRYIREVLSSKLFSIRDKVVCCILLDGVLSRVLFSVKK